jgi:hypothetical protein
VRESLCVVIKYDRLDYLQIFSHIEHHVASHEPFADGVLQLRGSGLGKSFIKDTGIVTMYFSSDVR